MSSENSKEDASSRMEQEPADETNVREVRTVLAEVREQIRAPRAARTLEEDRMDTDRDGGQNDEHVETTDWSTLRTALETAFGDLGGTKQHGTRGAVIRSKKEKGHLEYECRDGCLRDTKLGELKGLQLPGAFSGRPFGTLWNAWRAANIFIRSDIDTAAKIKFWKDGAVCLDEEALRKVLRLAYDKCLDWTEFICVTKEIKRHERIDDFGFDGTYDAALKRLKKELEEEERERRPIKEGPTAFAAPPSAALLQKDGPQRGITTKVAATFKQLREVLTELRANSIWVIVWPNDKNIIKEDVCEIIKACHTQLEEGCRIVTAWPAVVEKNADSWKYMAEVWKVLDDAVGRKAGPGQFVSTASTRIESGKIFCEVGSPESSLAFYGMDTTVGCAKILYEVIRKRCHGTIPLPELKKTYQLPRTAASEGGGMWQDRPIWQDRPRGRPVKRRDLGANWAA